MRPFSDVDLHAFLDDQVSPERRAMIAAYLKTAPTDAARVEGWRRQNDAIRTVFAGTATEPVPLWLTVAQVASGRERPRRGSPAEREIDVDLARTVPPARRIVRRRATGLSRVSAALLVVIAFAAGVSVATVPKWSAIVDRWLPDTPRTEQLRLLAASAIDNQRTFGMDPDRPAEVADKPAGTLATFLMRRLGTGVRVPDLTHAGWRLLGGRVVPGNDGPAAFLVYENSVGDRLGLTTERVTNPAPSDTAYAMTGPVLTWLDGPVGFAVTTSKEGSWLEENARTLYRAVYEGRDT